MALRAAPGYTTFGGRPLMQALAPAPKPARIAVAPNVGYTGSGWSYPSAGGVAQNFRIPTNPTLTGAIPGIPAVTGGGGGGGGPRTTTTVRTPIVSNYEGEIETDPLYQAGLSARQGRLNAGALTRAEGIRQAMIRGGYDPGVVGGALGAYAGDVDETTRAAAAANQLSDRAQLQQALDRGLYSLPYQLAARGGAGSGSQATGATSLNEQFQVGTEQARQNLLSAIQGRIGDWLQLQSGEEDRLSALRSDIANRLAQRAGYSETVTESGGEEGDLGGGGGIIPTTGTQMTPTQKTLAKVRAATAASKGWIAPNPVVNIPAVRAAAPRRRIGP